MLAFPCVNKLDLYKNKIPCYCSAMKEIAEH